MKRSGASALAGLLMAGVGLAALSGTCAIAAPADPAAACAALTAGGLFEHVAVTSANLVPADPGKGLPAYCEVTASDSPVAGSKIGLVYRLPEDWNGKMLGLGGGGWAGNVTLQGAQAGLKAGYATAQTNGGHESTSPWETGWAAKPEAITDFAYRAIHEMTGVGKQVVARYYGKPQSKAYYQGCSTGGRQGLMEVQRFPADYDGVITGAPVYNLLVQTSAVVRNNTFSAAGGGFTQDQLNRVNQAVLASCDAQDGLKDGLLADPRACKWDPQEIQCKDGAAGGDCLSKTQVEALRTAYRGVRTMDGRIAAWPLAKGGETGWSRFLSVSGPGTDATNGGGLGGLRGPILGDPNFDLGKFDPSSDLAKVRGGAFARAYEASDPVITAFTGKGGKLLMWHGWNDPGPSPIGTIAYYEQVAGVLPQGQSDVRLFLAPGVEHCGGGPGPDQFDLLGALDRWVQTGQPPATLLASKAGSKLSRPLCAYPAVARYKGGGDADDPASYECR